MTLSLWVLVLGLLSPVLLWEDEEGDREDFRFRLLWLSVTLSILLSLFLSF